MDLIEKETGIEKEEIHEKMKMLYLYVPGDGKLLPYCKSTTSLSTEQMTVRPRTSTRG